MEKARLLEELAAEIKVCPKCRLSETRTHAVPGEGSANARIMFVGEGPGENEDKTGRPFVGQAGKLLNKLLEEAGIEREDVFISNIVKCRPPGNRVPAADEVEACNDYLMAQIAITEPKFICPLGSSSLKTLLGAETENHASALQSSSPGRYSLHSFVSSGGGVAQSEVDGHVARRHEDIARIIEPRHSRRRNHRPHTRAPFRAVRAVGNQRRNQRTGNAFAI